MRKSTRAMSDMHESDLVDLLGGERTRNSGAVWSDQGDGHQTGSEEHYRLSWDGKATLARSITLTLDMWDKACEQSRNLIPALPLRFYANDRLTKVAADLMVVDLDTFAELLHDANQYRRSQRV